MNPTDPYEPPQHSSPPPLELMDSNAFGKRRRFWTWMSLAPALISLLGVVMVMFDRYRSDWILFPVANVWIAPVWLILCAAMVPAPRQMGGTWKAVLWKIGWYALFVIIQIVLIYASIFAGCSMMPPSPHSWH